MFLKRLSSEKIYKMNCYNYTKYILRKCQYYVFIDKIFKCSLNFLLISKILNKTKNFCLLTNDCLKKTYTQNKQIENTVESQCLILSYHSISKITYV